MLRFLLIILALLAIWKLLSHSRERCFAGHRPPAAVARAGYRRLGLGRVHRLYDHEQLHPPYRGQLGCAPNCTGPDPGAIALGIIVGFAIVGMTSAVLIWIVKGFLTPQVRHNLRHE
jgi:hypothetical protein